jgi:hypothetical protein
MNGHDDASESTTTDPMDELCQCPTCGQSTTVGVLQPIEAEAYRQTREERNCGGDMDWLFGEADAEEPPAP